MCTSASTACWRSTIRVATCSARSSIRNASSATTPSIASSKSSGKRDMCTPFCDGSRSTVQSIVAAISFSCAPRPMRTAFWTPVTPARERPIRTSGFEAWRSSSRRRVVSVTPILCLTAVADDTSFAKLVTLACHDLRTPLATVHGFVKTLERMAELEPPADRYIEMIGEASVQLAGLLDDLSLAARIEGGRYDPVLRAVDTLVLAQSAAARLVGIESADDDRRAVGRRRVPVDESLRHRGRSAAAVADGLELVDELRTAQELGERSERPPAEVLVEARGDDARSPCDQHVDHEHDLGGEELHLVDPDHVVAVGEPRNVLGPRDGDGAHLRAGVADDVADVVAVVDARLHDQRALAGDLR